MAQIKITVQTALKRNIEKKAKKIGIKPTQYIFSLIVNDLNNEVLNKKND